MTSTATTHQAKDHARAQEGARAEAQQTVPTATATRLPDGVTADEMLWEETVGPGGYAVRRLPRGARLRLTDRLGDTSVQLLVFNAHQPTERLNVADTVKIQWQAYLSAGQLLLSDMGRVLLSVVEDSSAGHDTFNAMSNLRWNVEKYGSGSVHGASPNARDLFAVALTKAGLDRRDIHPSVNLFKRISVAPDGRFEWHGESSTQGAEVILRCETDVLVAMAVTPHVLDPRTVYTVTPLDISAWRGDPTPADDPIRLASPEGRRAFENTEDWILTRAEEAGQ